MSFPPGPSSSRRSGLAVAGITVAASLLLCWTSAAADVFAMPPGLTSLELVEVGQAGNAPAADGRGSVGHDFRIGRFEVTAAQWVEFLNGKGRSEADGGLWNNDMDSALSGPGPRCEIRRSGEAGGYRYSVAPEHANRPVTHVSFLDACRFCNWLHNGQGDGDTETGAYTLAGYRGTDGRRIRRNAGARFFVPTEDEWYKAAYFDPGKPGGAGYWRYPTRSDEKPGYDPASANAANHHREGEPGGDAGPAPVGHHALAAGPHGTFDQAGNVFEWTDGLVPPFLRTLRGGAWSSDDAGINLPVSNPVYSSVSDVIDVGFRIAASSPGSDIPAPAAHDEVVEPSVADFPRRPWIDPLTGEPFFPLAWFSYASDERDLDELATMGANLVLFVNAPADVDSDELLRANVVAMRRYLDHAERRGIRVLVQVGSWFSAHLRGDDAEIARQREWVMAVRDHPALFGYQLYDEPEYAAGFGLGVESRRRLADLAGALVRTREALRRWDDNPRRMVSVVFNLVPLSSWTEYLPAVDSFQVDRYPLDRDQAYFGHRGDWGPLMMAWSMGHGARALHDHPHLRNPSPCMQGVGSEHTEGGTLGVWRTPLYEETRYMAYSSLTVGGWGVFHWIRAFGRPDNPVIAANVSRLYRELAGLLPALRRSYEDPPFTVAHDHLGISRTFLTDSVADVTTLALEDADRYYVVACGNAAALPTVTLRLRGARFATDAPRVAEVLGEGWHRTIRHDADTGEWVIDPHAMCFGDVNVWVIAKDVP